MRIRGPDGAASSRTEALIAGGAARSGTERALARRPLLPLPLLTSSDKPKIRTALRWRSGRSRSDALRPVEPLRSDRSSEGRARGRGGTRTNLALPGAPFRRRLQESPSGRIHEYRESPTGIWAAVRFFGASRSEVPTARRQFQPFRIEVVSVREFATRALSLWRIESPEAIAASAAGRQHHPARERPLRRGPRPRAPQAQDRADQQKLRPPGQEAILRGVARRSRASHRREHRVEGSCPRSSALTKDSRRTSSPSISRSRCPNPAPERPLPSSHRRARASGSTIGRPG